MSFQNKKKPEDKAFKDLIAHSNFLSALLIQSGTSS